MKICYSVKMKNRIGYFLVSLILIIMSIIDVNAQGNVSIGANPPDASAMLDIQSSSLGLLIPRMTQANRPAPASAAQGLMIFNLTTNKFNYFDGTDWQEFIGGVSPWVTTGNSITTAWNGTTGSFLGTSNNRPLVIGTTDASAQSIQFWTNNTEKIRLTGDGKLAVGLTNPLGFIDVKQPNTLEAGDAPALNIIRDNNGGVISSTYPVVRIIQDNSADQNAALYAKQDGVPATPIELPAVYGMATANTSEQAIGIWGDATGGQGTIGVLATGNTSSNVALQINDGEFAMGRSSAAPSPGTVTDAANGGTEYSDNGPSGVIELTLGASGDLTTSPPTTGTFQELGTVTINNTFSKTTSIVLINVINKTNAGAGPSPLNSLFLIDVETRANGSFTVHVGMIPNETSAQNYDNDKIKLGYMIVNPSK